MAVNNNISDSNDIPNHTVTATVITTNNTNTIGHDNACGQDKCTMEGTDVSLKNIENVQTDYGQQEKEKEKEKRDRSPSVDSVKPEKKKFCCCHDANHVTKETTEERNNSNVKNKTVDTLSTASTGTNENVNSKNKGNTNESFKFFIGGIPQFITNKDITEYFGQYGTVQNVIIAQDHKTKRNRGFAFVTMASQENIDKILKGPHELNGKRVDVREENNTTPSDIQRKIFVGGLNYFWTKDILAKYFSAYGEIDVVQIVVDSSGRSRCFGFVVFANEHSVAKVLKHKKHKIHDKIVEVRKAEPKKPKSSYKKAQPKCHGKCQHNTPFMGHFPCNKETMAQWANFMYSTCGMPFLFNQRFQNNMPDFYSPYNTNNNYFPGSMENVPSHDYNN